MIEIALLLAALGVGHWLADLVLQPPYVSAGKRSPSSGERWRWLGLHGVAHGFFVSIVLGPVLGVLEALAHAAIDRGKCAGLYGMKVDQSLHVACKLVWLALYLEGIC